MALPQLCENSEDYVRMRDETMMEEYWKEIRPLSFQTSFLPLPVEAAKELRLAYSSFSSSSSSPSKPTKTIQWEGKEMLGDVKGNPLPHLSELMDKIDETVASSPFLSSFFVRLSTRSPKDAVLVSEKFQNICEEELKLLTSQEEGVYNDSSDLNRRLHALYRASTYAMKLTKGIEALNLLITSARIQDDLAYYTENEDKDLKYNIILREFADFLPELEFRVFVYDKKVTAVTQYNPLCYFPRLKEKMKEVEKVIIDYLNGSLLKDGNFLLPEALKGCIIDVVLYNPNDRNSYENLVGKIIEINPLAEFASSGLFSFEKDKKVLLGMSDFEFRFVEKIPVDQKLKVRMMAPAWKAFVGGSY